MRFTLTRAPARKLRMLSYENANKISRSEIKAPDRCKQKGWPHNARFTGRVVGVIKMHFIRSTVRDNRAFAPSAYSWDERNEKVQS